LFHQLAYILHVVGRDLFCSHSKSAFVIGKRRDLDNMVPTSSLHFYTTLEVVILMCTAYQAKNIQVSLRWK